MESTVEQNMLLSKIEEWRNKALAEQDAFNKYISVFIAYNIFCNMYEKTKNHKVDLSKDDAKKAIATIELVTEPRLLFLSLKPNLDEYLRIIPIYQEEHWWEGHQKIPIATRLKQATEEEDSHDVIKMLLMWLYRVRCNLVHGEKNYNDPKQRKLLAISSTLLDEVLKHLIESYRNRYG